MTKTTTTADPVAAAAAMLQVLAEKRAEALARKTNVLEEIGSHGYAAQAEGNKAAKKRITELSVVVAEIDVEIVTLDAAEREGRKRLAAAKADAERAAAVARAILANEQVERFRYHGGRLAALLVDLINAYEKTLEAGAQIRRLKVIRAPGGEVVSVAIKGALETALRQHPELRSGPLLTISSRDISGVVDFLATQMESAIKRVISGEVPPPVEYDPPPPLELLPGEAELIAAELAAEQVDDAPEVQAAE